MVEAGSLTESEPRYDVALSFAGEQRSYVEAVAGALRDSGIKVFYDDYEKTSLWGRDLYTHLDYIYRQAARFCVTFVSADYSRKVWTNHERQSAQARALQENDEYILPVRFDDTDVPGLRPTIGHVDATKTKPADLAQMIKEKVGPRQVTAGFPTRVDRLYKSIRKETGRKVEKDRRQDVRGVAYSLYDALRRMTESERRAVVGVFAFGCPGELPDLVHVSLDRVSRMLRMPPVEVVESLSAVRSLNFRTALRDSLHETGEGEVAGDDRDVTIRFWSQRVPHESDSTRIAYHTIKSAAHHFCSDHGLIVVQNLDFHRLSSAEDRTVTVSDVVDS